MENLEQHIKNSSVEDKDRLILNLGCYLEKCINDRSELEKEIKSEASRRKSDFLDKTYARGCFNTSLYAKNDLIYIMIKIYDELGLDKIYKKEYQEMIESIKNNAEDLGLFVQTNYKVVAKIK